MGSTSETRKGFGKEDGKDRLSELPNEILVHILSFLPTIDAIRTVLIRTFGNLWTLVPSLNFHDLEYEEARFGPSAKLRHGELYSHFANFVRNAIVLHKREPIDTFRLRMNSIDDLIMLDKELFYNEITTWLRFLTIEKEVKNLEVIDIPGSFLPQCLFTSQLLVTLKLVRCQDIKLTDVHMGSLRKLLLSRVILNGEMLIRIIQGSPSLQELTLMNVTGLNELPSQFPGNCRVNGLNKAHMGSLKQLRLKEVNMSDELFNEIIHGCPSLEEVALNTGVTGLNELRFTTPNIQKLSLSSFNGLLDCPYLKVLSVFTLKLARHLQIIDLSSIREVDMRFCHHYNVYDAVLNNCCDAEVFKLSIEDFQISGFNKLNIPQTRWKRLHIDSDLHGDTLSVVSKVLKSSPHLEELVIYSDSGITGGHEENILSAELPSELSSCLMPRLKIVTVQGYKLTCNGLLRLLELLLKGSVVLEKLIVLHSKKNSEAVDEHKFSEQLASFQWASTNASIIFSS